MDLYYTFCGYDSYINLYSYKKTAHAACYYFVHFHVSRCPLYSFTLCFFHVFQGLLVFPYLVSCGIAFLWISLNFFHVGLMPVSFFPC